MEILSNTEYKSILGYLPATIIKNVIESKVDLSKQLPQHYCTDSVGLFSDISGFTKLSEAFSKKGRIGPECLTFCINRYMEQIINIIGANGGDIFKFVGDAIMVIWPPDDSPNFLETACRRAVQCAVDIQNKLNNLEIVKGKTLSVKIGIGVGQCHILFVGGLFGRCEYLCVGEAMRQACESETHSSGGGQILMSELVQKHLIGSYNFIQAEVQPGYSKTDNLTYYMIERNAKGEYGKGNKVSTKADAFLMKKKFDKKRLTQKLKTLRTFLPAGVKSYLNIEKEPWCKEIRLITSMFLNIKIDLSQLKDESAFQRVQAVANTVQRCIYRTRGALNKFLMDDKGSVMLVAWGLPPYSSRDDPLSCVCSGLTILSEFKKLGLKCGMGVATGTCCTGICGTVGNRREYSLLGEIVNLSSRYMSKGLEYMKKNELDSILVIDEKTKDLIQHKIRCKYILTSKLKGFSVDFNFFVPVVDDDLIVPKIEDPFPLIRTHFSNPINFYNNIIYDDKRDLANSLEVFGRKKEIDALLRKLQFVYKNKTKKVIVIRGQYGSGKTLLIRKVLNEFFMKDGTLKEEYFNPKIPNLVLCCNQYPLLQFIPFNGFCFIFRQIYMWLDKHLFSKEVKKKLSTVFEFEVLGDTFASLIMSTGCIESLDYIEEMLNSSFEDINLSKHFDERTFNENLRQIISLRKSKNEAKGKKRDPFFAGCQIESVRPIINFLVSLLKLYRRYISPGLPLILVIEETHQIDEYSIMLITHLLNTAYQELNPLVILLTYQDKFRAIKHQNDKISLKNELIFEMTLKEFIESNEEDTVSVLQIKNFASKSDIENILKQYVIETSFFKRIDSLFKVDPILMSILIEKTFGGVPLFIRELFDQFIKEGFIQNCVEEILITSELEDMYKTLNWNDFNLPTRIEKVCGEMIDSIQEKEIIILKYASTIGALFDIETLHSIIPFQNVQLKDLYSTLKSFEEKGIIDFLYDSSAKKKVIVCQFSFPFIRETLYQRMLIEQRSEIHSEICRLLQKTKFSYLPSYVEKKNLENHLEAARNTIMVKMEETNSGIEDDNKNKEIDINSMKILLVKEICDKLRDVQLNIEHDEEIEQGHIKGIEKLQHTIRYGMIDKKSDGKITWESRFFVLTAKAVNYYYRVEEYIDDKVPLATFELKDMYNIVQLKDGSVGGRKNIFSLSVIKWIKKEIPQGPRTYIFSCPNVIDYYTWLISLNFVKVNAYYDSFALNFGLVRFPVYNKEKMFPKKKKRMFLLDEEKKEIGTLLSGRRASTSFGKDMIMVEKKDILVYFGEMIGKSFTVLLGVLEEGTVLRQQGSGNEIINHTSVTPFFHTPKVLSKVFEDKESEEQTSDIMKKSYSQSNISKTQSEIEETHSCKAARKNDSKEEEKQKNEVLSKETQEKQENQAKNQKNSNGKFDKLIEEESAKEPPKESNKNLSRDSEEKSKKESKNESKKENNSEEDAVEREKNLLNEINKQNLSDESSSHSSSLSQDKKSYAYNTSSLEASEVVKKDLEILDSTPELPLVNLVFSTNNPTIKNENEPLHVFEDSVLPKLKSMNIDLGIDEQYYLSLSQQNLPYVSKENTVESKS